jgi:hypothetical protein
MIGNMARTLFRSLAVLSLSVLWGQAYAQEVDSYAADPPERAARLSFITGDVSLQPAGEEEWAPALLNRPLTTGDKIWTEEGARAEIAVGPADIRLDSFTGFSFLNVDNDVVQMRITAGVMNVSVLSLAGNEQIEIDTPNAAISLLRSGSYRIEVNDAGDATVVKIAQGSAEVTGPSQNVVVHADQVVTFTGTDELVAHFDRLGSPDDFDSWIADRDRREERAASSRTAQYVSPDVTGYEDLEDNGSWSSEPEYGYVWTPTRVAVGWSPYRYGRWVSVAPWGWTWIDDAPWGYAPFHYGRWAHVRNRWCWVPGPRHMRAVYAPALVGWVGSPGLNVTWFPLGPREVYIPGRRYSRHYYERVNVSNTVIVNRALAHALENRGSNYHYRNRTAPGGVTTVSRTAFTSAGRVHEHRDRDHESRYASAPATAVAPQISPLRESRLGGRPRANTRVPPRAVVDRQVVVRREPPSAAARFARPVVQNSDRVRDRVDRGDRDGRGDRGTARSGREVLDRAAIVRDRPEREDRPWRSGRPVESTPQVASPVSDPRGIAARVRQDGERQVLAEQQRRELEQRQREAVRQRWERQDDQPREQREREQREPRDQQAQAWRERQGREREQRQSEPRQQQSRPIYQRERVEQREQPAPRERPVMREQRERSVERPQVQRPPQAERPRREQPQRSESRGQSESRPQPGRRQDNGSPRPRD